MPVNPFRFSHVRLLWKLTYLILYIIYILFSIKKAKLTLLYFDVLDGWIVGSFYLILSRYSTVKQVFSESSKFKISLVLIFQIDKFESFCQAKLLEDMMQLLDSSEYSDFTIHCANEVRIPAHRLILMARCPAFKKVRVNIYALQIWCGCKWGKQKNILF